MWRSGLVVNWENLIDTFGGSIFCFLVADGQDSKRWQPYYLALTNKYVLQKRVLNREITKKQTDMIKTTTTKMYDPYLTCQLHYKKETEKQNNNKQ